MGDVFRVLGRDNASGIFGRLSHMNDNKPIT